ncbi:hypothetical protein TW95_gp0062 [Pandoravirus inopinatum]|uniref:Uncharacterized protein n=1 Tax=Pandoravirus inopinatum TaxID=1605721 RepID=A0A0B5J7R2_9VIRU|nr:hypothetical protein TW95_gp0062 [Pandoravirus inopinatum]AJF96796.1 hypothetical protein [Pandoravirus inopinatum]
MGGQCPFCSPPTTHSPAVFFCRVASGQTVLSASLGVPGEVRRRTAHNVRRYRRAVEARLGRKDALLREHEAAIEHDGHDKAQYDDAVDPGRRARRLGTQLRHLFLLFVGLCTVFSLSQGRGACLVSFALLGAAVSGRDPTDPSDGAPFLSSLSEDKSAGRPKGPTPFGHHAPFLF